MTDRVREGDIVTVRVLVTHVADYDNGQQIIGKMLPNGESVGWLLPDESQFYLDQHKFQKGDLVWMGGQRKGEVVALHEVDGTQQLWVRCLGSWKLETIVVNPGTRRA